MKELLPVSVPISSLMPSFRAFCINAQRRSKCRFIRLMSSCTCSAPTFRPSSTTIARKVLVGMIGMPALATASRSRSVARSAWMIQSTPASAAARVEPAPREWMPPHLRNHLVRGIAELPDGVIGRSFPGRLVILDAAVGHDHATCNVHARPYHEPELDRVAYSHIREPGSARDRDAGHPRAQHLLHAARRFEGGEFGPGRAFAFPLSLDQRVTVRDMAVCIDETGHDPLPAGVDQFHPAVFDRHVWR